MPTHHPHDQFDDIPEVARVGAHRAPAPAGRGWKTFAWAALATGVLVGAGYLGISAFNTGDVDLGSAAATPTPEPASTVVPLTDPADIDKDRDVSISILDGTNVTGNGQAVYKALDKDGWPVEEPAEADKTDTETTIVYYTDAANEDIALGLVDALGVGKAKLVDAELGATLRVLVGSDYAEANG